MASASTAQQAELCPGVLAHTHARARAHTHAQSPSLAHSVCAQGWRCAAATLDAEIDTVLLDCDGVLWNGDSVVGGAREALASFRAAGKRLLFITNNSTKSRETAAEKYGDVSYTRPATACFTLCLSVCLSD